MDNPSPTLIAAGVILLLVIIGCVIFAIRAKQRTDLRSQFGEEYDRTVRRTGSKRTAEKILQERQKRVADFNFRDLSAEEYSRFVEAWNNVQARFVDDPGGALGHADLVISDAMTARGYPVSDFEARAADLSVDHPKFVENYRAGRKVAVKHVAGEATTEEMRRALINYRALFEDLVKDPSVLLSENLADERPDSVRSRP
jgi:hypothetical protein